MHGKFAGRCHCESLGYVYRTDIAPQMWAIRACQCSFCRAHDALSTSDPAGTIEFFANDDAALQKYRFAMRTGDFLLCKRCGMYAGAVLDTNHGQFGIINLRLLQKIPARMPNVVAVSYARESAAGRVSRREERWTPVNAVP